MFLFTGIVKLIGLAGTVAFLGQLGLPGWLAYFVTAGEILSGLAMLTGLYVRYAGWILAAIMAGASIRYFFNSCSGSPDSPNESCMPINSIGTGWVRAKNSATALPSPPAT